MSTASEEDVFTQAIELDVDANSPQKKRSKVSHKKPIGGAFKFPAQYTEKYKEQFIEASKKGNDQFYCIACDKNLVFQKCGEKAIKDHIEGKKHKEKVAVVNKNQPILSFVKRKTVSEEKRALAVELVMAFHSGRHNFSMSSTDCSSDLFPKFYDDCLSYINKWSAHLENIASFFGNWLTFECRFSSENILGSYKQFCSTKPQESDDLFGEIAELNETVEHLVGTEFDAKPVDEK